MNNISRRATSSLIILSVILSSMLLICHIISTIPWGLDEEIGRIILGPEIQGGFTVVSLTSLMVNSVILFTYMKKKNPFEIDVVEWKETDNIN